MKPDLRNLAVEVARRVQAGASYDELPYRLRSGMESLSPAEQRQVESFVIDLFDVAERRNAFRTLIVGAALMAFVFAAGMLLGDVVLVGLKGAGY